MKTIAEINEKEAKNGTHISNSSAALGVVAIAFGGTFLGLGVAKNNELKEAMR